MRKDLKILLFFIVFVCAKLQNVNSDSGYVTLWTPKFAQEDARYSLFVLPTDLNRRTEIAVQFRKSSAAFMLTDGKVSTVEYPSEQRDFGGRKSLDLIMTLYRNMTSSAGTQMHCSTKQIDILPSKGNFHNFIQTDKPIYKPGDTVQFRILTVDKDLKPFHRNTIDVNITDPFGRVIMQFEDQEKKFFGVFESNFTLSNSTTLGDWKVTVIVDKKIKMATSKVFAVQKYTLPLFDVHIDIPKRHVLQQDEVVLSIYAKYSFEEFVRGNAEMIIRRVDDGKIYLNKKLTDIKEPMISKHNLKDLGVITRDEMKLEAFVIFTEPESKISFNKTAEFYAHYDEQHKLIVQHTPKYLPGFPFTVNVYVKNWKDEKIMNHFEKVELTHYFKLKNGTTGEIVTLGILENGVYVNENVIPSDYVELKLIVNFPNSKIFRKTIEMGSVNVGINTLAVSYLPERPKVNDIVKVFVTSENKLKTIIMAIITRYGISQNRQIECNDQQICEFEIKIMDAMMPYSTIMVYDVKNKNTIYQGQAEVVTEDVGRNELKLELPTESVKTKEQIKMKFTTKAKSKIYMLAFDRRLNSLRTGNDITKKDVVESLSDYDGENQILVDDLTSWNVCTPEELERVAKGRSYIVKHSKDRYYSKEAEDEADDNEDWDDDPSKDKTEASTPDNLLREYFPETWIFESFEADKSSAIEKMFKTPDAITTWMISAFAVHKQAGLALAQPQELTVKNDFFVKVNLPYSIRYKEVLKLNIMSFNYVKTNEELNVKLKLHNVNGNEFEFVDYHNCKPTYSTEDHLVAETDFKILPNEAKSFSFYIRSNQANNKFDPQIGNQMLIRVEAIATDRNGNRYEDRVQKRLNVEPVGVKVYSISSEFYKLDNSRIPSHMNHANYSSDLSSVNVIVTGDFLSKSFNLDKFETFPSSCLEQRTSKLKRYTDTFRYLTFIGRDMSTDMPKNLYQDILRGLDEGYHYVEHPWYRAYLANVLAMAMQNGALAPDRNRLFESLDKVERQQESNGTFSNFVFYYGFPGQAGTSDYKATTQYFSAAYCLIPFLKHKDFLGTRYDVFINKGIRFLKNPQNRLEVYSFGLSVAAYALALRGEVDEAKLLLSELEKVKFHDGNKKCYKVYSTDAECNIRHTSFAALALITLDNLIDAEPVVHWLLERNQADDMSTGNNAIITEPITEMAIRLRTNDTSLNVVIKDEREFSTQLTIKDFNSHIPQNIRFPKYSEEVRYEISGKGYCTITMLFERIVTVPKVTPNFDITIISDINSPVPNQKIVNICAKYTKQEGMKPILVNVLYEIEMPSGYTFVEVKDAKKHSEIKHIDSKKGGTVIHLYYNEFEANNDYCVDVVTKQEFVVNEASDAGIKVYDFDNKENVAIEFYRFDSREC